MKYLVVLLSIFICSFTVAVNAITFTKDEQYIGLDLTPLCTVDGQVTLTLTNTSGQKLFVDPHIADPALFDLARARMYLRNANDNKLIGMSPLSEYVKTSNWSVLPVGGVITYPIDFTKHVALDTAKFYRAGAEIRMKILLDNGQEVVVKIDSAILNKYVDIKPDCFI
ncbi:MULTISPECIES: hypothetical protein [Shewanella]|uniref:Uncharacterized protein n=1 Tax=Shewanella xiamenensis TaxID=332186 RepID=A0ABT6UA50_9GAMM|nr:MULTISPECIES: hypothetical protein [Shewanella]MCH7425068.1 hypothetical protein [Shewanella sp. MM_2022_3]MDI5831349.1 hypothetical protein [Shewanella xiamenensis]NSM24769.1 hypothetical protein [Shewanella sp. ZOR0012]